MRYKADQKEETRKKIVVAAGRSFKKGGYNGVGVDGLAKEAGVTSGAFYGNFPSKKEAFKEAMSSGMDELGSDIAHFKSLYGENWWVEFAEFYTSQKGTSDLTESCALQALTPEVVRLDEDVRALFETELLKVVELASNKHDRDKAWSSLAILTGGVTLARAVKDENLSHEIADAIKNAVVSMCEIK